MTLVDTKHSLVAQKKMLRILLLIRMLCEARYTVFDLAEVLKVDERSILRYFDLLEFMDVPIEKDFNGKYFIVQGGCPLCGLTTNNPLL